MGHQLAYITAAIILPLIFILICCVTAFSITANRSWYFKLIVWGAFSMLLISPVLSFVASQVSVVITSDGWVGIGVLMLSFGITEALSILSLITGTVWWLVVKFKKQSKECKAREY